MKQLVNPKMQLCKPLGFNQQNYQCGPEQQERCKSIPAPSKTVCGYSEDGTSEEFVNECEACKENRKLKLFFRSKCKWAPKVCKKEE